MRYGVLSEAAAGRLLGDKQQGGLKVRYEPHPNHPNEMAIEVWRDDDGVYLGGYVSVGHDGIVNTD